MEHLNLKRDTQEQVRKLNKMKSMYEALIDECPKSPVANNLKLQIKYYQKKLTPEQKQEHNYKDI